MKVYPASTIARIRSLRTNGLTYREINDELGMSIPKGTLSYLCKGISPGNGYEERIVAEAHERLRFIRELAVKKNRQILERRFADARMRSRFAAGLVKDKQVAKIALAMLYLGEGAKWKGRRGLMLGSADPNIVSIYIQLLGICYGIGRDELRCRLQYRADQDGEVLLDFWSSAINIPKEQFYKPYVDKRTVGQTTKKSEYKGVCSVTCAGADIQLELQAISDIIYEALGH